MQIKMSKHRSQLLASRAHAMRVAPTASEQLLFEALRAAFPGVAFRRQLPLCGRFIADLYAPSFASRPRLAGRLWSCRDRHVDVSRSTPDMALVDLP
jgi:hypothetical protein